MLMRWLDGLDLGNGLGGLGSSSVYLRDTLRFTIVLTKKFRIYVNFFGIRVAIINQQFLSRSNILFCYIVESSFALCDKHILFCTIASTIDKAKPRRNVDVICINIMSYKSSTPSLKIQNATSV